MLNKQKVIEINVQDGYLNIGKSKLFPETEKQLLSIFDQSIKLESGESKDSMFQMQCQRRGKSSDFDLINHKDSIIEFYLLDVRGRMVVCIYLCEKQCEGYGMEYKKGRDFYFNVVRA